MPLYLNGSIIYGSIIYGFMKFIPIITDNATPYQLDRELAISIIA